MLLLGPNYTGFDFFSQVKNSVIEQLMLIWQSRHLQIPPMSCFKEIQHADHWICGCPLREKLGVGREVSVALPLARVILGDVGCWW